MPTIEIRPGIINRAQWFPDRANNKTWDHTRLAVLTRDDFTCAGCGHRAIKYMTAHHVNTSDDDSLDNLVTLCKACHAVLHIGLNLMHGAVEVWETELSQVEIIQQTRAGIGDGKSLETINAGFARRAGPLPPDSRDYANQLVLSMGNALRASLPLPLSVIFVKFTLWQIEPR